MDPLLATRINDLVNMTLRDLGRPNYTELTTDIQNFIAFNNLLNKNRVEMGGGIGAQWDVMVNHAQSAANVGMGAKDNLDIVDTMVQAQADWRHTTANWALIGQEIDMNSGESRIVDMVKQREAAALIAHAEKMERNFWGPPVAIDDEVTPWGVNTWLVKNASEGFNGGAPSGYTSIGLNPTTYPRWKNYTAPYTDVTPDDMIAKWSKAATFTNFKPPIQGLQTFNQYAYDYGYYTNYQVYGPCEQQLRAQNENNGDDLVKYDGQVMFRRVPLTWVPLLEADTTGPLYGISWNSFKTIYLKNWWLRRTRVPVYPGQHTINATFLDSTYQWCPKNRRCHFVISNGTSYPS